MSEFPAYEAALLAAARRRYGWRRWRPRAAGAVIAAAAAGVVLLVARPPAPDDERVADVPWTTTSVPRYGLAVSLPPGWELARATLTPYLDDPREIMSATTFAPGRPEQRCAPFPAAALRRLSAADALVTVQERGTGSPPQAARPRPFAAPPATGTARFIATCIGRPVPGVVTWTPFSDGRRNFHALVVVGSGASPAVRGEAYAILDRLRFDPGFRPSWPFAG